MNNIYMIDENVAYSEAEQKASHYFQLLQNQIQNQSFIQTLKEDIKKWKKNHTSNKILPFMLRGKTAPPNGRNYQQYLKYLNYKGNLTNYLHRSVSYIFLRDLGKTLNSTKTQDRIQQIVHNLMEQINESDSQKDDITNLFSFYGMYRKAQEENIELTMIWLFEKLQLVSKNIPEEMDAINGRRKLIKIIAGVMMHVHEEMDEELAKAERMKQYDEAIRLGYSYGLTYPFIDDLLDCSVLDFNEKKRYSSLIRQTLLTGEVPDFGKWEGKNEQLMQFIHKELEEAFTYIKQHQESQSKFFEQSYVFFHSQEVDRNKELNDPHYTNEELFIPIILKSASSRLIARSMLNVEEDKGFDQRTFLYGIYNQLADDFADMFQDQNDGAVTPYTYYLKYHHQRKDLINPFELYWVVISNLIHNVYKSDVQTSEVIIDRAINGLKRFREKVGVEMYKKVMTIFALQNTSFQKLIEKLVDKAENVEFYDKLLRDQMINSFKDEKEELKEFAETIRVVQNKINDNLTIEVEEQRLVQDPVLEAANYSLKGGGKRLRPILTWFMGVKIYGLNEGHLIPLLKSLEYMHTASLIFDDLPTQDNASTRRGHPTVHELYNVATAELAGLFLTQKAFEEQASMDEFEPKSVLQLIQYAARMTAEMCQGQAMDLESKGKILTIDELETISFYKTGLGFEACLIMPAILAQVSMEEKEILKKFARHAGIAFQIKDDLLDVEGDSELLGKTVGKDVENNKSTFVSLLGIDGAKIEMWNHYCIAMESLENIPRSTTFLKHFLNYIVNREK
nr:polyprenyl synthetase family protein [Lysinibacillus timonensis]